MVQQLFKRVKNLCALAVDERKGLQLLRRCAAGAVVLVIAANAVSKFDLYGGSRSND